MSHRTNLLAAVFSGFILVSAGCATQAGRQADDQRITSQFNSSLLADPQLSGLNINADARRGTVRLSGSVNSNYQKRRAEALARSIAGVQEVKNDIEVK